MMITRVIRSPHTTILPFACHRHAHITRIYHKKHHPHTHASSHTRIRCTTQDTNHMDGSYHAVISKSPSTHKSSRNCSISNHTHSLAKTHNQLALSRYPIAARSLSLCHIIFFPSHRLPSFLTPHAIKLQKGNTQKGARSFFVNDNQYYIFNFQKVKAERFDIVEVQKISRGNFEPSTLSNTRHSS